MICIRGREYRGWREAFIRTCVAMAREGTRSRDLVPRGQINARLEIRCPVCHSDCFFRGHDLECGSFYETATAHFCCNCEEFKVVTDQANYASYNPRKVLQMMKFKIALSPERYSNAVASRPCPVCGAGTYTFHKDLGGIDYYDNSWTVCTNQFCDWPGLHSEEFEWGPCTPTVWESGLRRYETVFISYNSLDQEFANALYEKLTLHGVACWYAPHHIRGGQTVREQVQSAVRKQDRVLVIISEASMDSEWVQYEISEARRREKDESRRVLFPISVVEFGKLKNWVIEDDESPDLAKEIRKYFIPDFSQWREKEAFQSELGKLLDALDRG